MKRKKKATSHSDSHRWVISYADFITLLFAFFVVMYAISSVNEEKYKSLSDGLNSAFNEKDKNRALISTDTQNDGTQELVSQGTYHDGLDEMEKLLASFADNDYKIKRNDGWIELQIRAGSLFTSADAELKPEAIMKLMKLAGKIKKYQFPIIVEGFTDNVPISSLQFPSNWELSASRAATVGRVLNSYGVPSEQIIVSGYADQYPLMDNVTELGKSMNRRVNIVIVKNRTIPRALNPEVSAMTGVVQGDISTAIEKAQDKKQKKQEVTPTEVKKK